MSRAKKEMVNLSRCGIDLGGDLQKKKKSSRTTPLNFPSDISIWVNVARVIKEWFFISFLKIKYSY